MKIYVKILIITGIILSATFSLLSCSDVSEDEQFPYAFRIISVGDNFSGYLYCDDDVTWAFTSSYNIGSTYGKYGMVPFDAQNEITIHAVTDSDVALSLDIYLYLDGIEIEHVEGTQSGSDPYIATLTYTIGSDEDEEESE